MTMESKRNDRRRKRVPSKKVKVGSSYDLDYHYAKKGQDGRWTPNPDINFNMNNAGS